MAEGVLALRPQHFVIEAFFSTEEIPQHLSSPICDIFVFSFAIQLQSPESLQAHQQYLCNPVRNIFAIPFAIYLQSQLQFIFNIICSIFAIPFAIYLPSHLSPMNCNIICQYKLTVICLRSHWDCSSGRVVPFLQNRISGEACTRYNSSCEETEKQRYTVPTVHSSVTMSILLNLNAYIQCPILGPILVYRLSLIHI